MENKRWVICLIAVWTGAIALFLYIPIFSVITSSFGKSRYFRFPVKAWSDKWYDQTLGANLTTDLHLTSFYVAGSVALIAVVLGFFGALAFARYNWRGRQFYQRLIMLPIFFPQAVLGLALLLWFTFVGVLPSWEAAVFAHLVWIVPIVTLVISIQVYGFDAAQEEAAYDLGASRW
ncbi:MAG: ABC transporter permease subunit, partial [Rhodospirillaceae bacterium]|nr:ABC transporter permease subunit [Rhodospirillaceae bacterium]